MPITDGYTDFSGVRAPIIGDVVGNIQGGLKGVAQIASGDGAITVQPGVAVITKATAAVLTLAAPTAGTHDGVVLIIISSTAAAHTVTQTTPGFNGGGAATDVATAAVAIGSSLILVAYNGVWLIANNTGFTLA